ncbi:MAG TPA: ABC transporter permease [Gammaproteobacteria bacterium]|nr:ABC transporter permease [Gammaproteobacteria bacterium]
MTLRNILLVAQRDYVAYVARPRFWIGLLLTPAILLAFIFIPILIQQFQTAKDYVVVDHSGWIMPAVEQRIAASDYTRLIRLAAHTAPVDVKTLPTVLAKIKPAAEKLHDDRRKTLGEALAAGKPVPTEPDALAIWQQRAALIEWYRTLTPKQASALDHNLAIARFHLVTQAPANLRAAVNSKKLFAWFDLPTDPLKPDAKYTYASLNLTDTDLRDWFGRLVTTVVQTRKAAQSGLSADKAKWLQENVDFDSQLVTAKGAKTATTAEQVAQWLPVGYVYLLFLAIMPIAQLLMMSTIEEKSTRIAESLLSAIESSDIVAGKTLGVAGVGITMVLGWLILILGLVAGTGALFTLGGTVAAVLAGISVGNIVWFLVYFVLGFLLFASILGAIGASVNNIREAQPYVTPVILSMTLPLILMIPIVKDPSAIWARVLSYIPPLTPFLMMNRSAAPPPVTDYIFTTLLLIATVVLVLYASGRIFKIGLLNTGAPPKLRELLGWLRDAGPRTAAPENTAK